MGATNETQMLALSPTRELAEQTQKVCLALGDYMNVQCHTCIGGKSIGEDIRRLDYGVQIVSGTPGRVFDMIQRRSLQTRNLKMLVIDEADEMLNRGFKDQIYDIYRYLPPHRPVGAVRAQGRGHQLREERGRAHPAGHRAVLLDPDRRDADERRGPDLGVAAPA